MPSVGARLPPGEIIQRLDSGWPPESGLIEEFIQAWRKVFGIEAEIREIATDAAYFTCSIDAIRLKGFSDLHCLMLGGRCDDLGKLQSWKTRLSGPGRQVLVLSLGADPFRRAESTFPGQQGHLLIPRQEVSEIFLSPTPDQFLKSAARRRLSPLRLNPFGILTPPDANMFVGRQTEVEMLKQSESISYAVAGPGRVGKTSLIQNLRRDLQRSDPIRFLRMVLVDFMNCSETSDQGICQFLAVQINDGKRARELRSTRLEGFLRAERRLRQGPLELLLDEVDKVCESETFKVLAEAAKNNICRLVLCGRGVLYESMHDPKSILCGRLRLMRLPPLSEEEAQTLLLSPLGDLGLQISEPRRLAEEILSDTGRSPSLIQFYGGALVELSVRQRTDSITLDSLEIIRKDYETAQRFASPILSLDNDVAEWVALALLHQQQASFTEQEIAHVAHSEGLRLDEKEISRLCRNLYISNVLLWGHDRYHIANRALSRYARKLGYFAPRLAELRKLGGRVVDVHKSSGQ